MSAVSDTTSPAQPSYDVHIIKMWGYPKTDQNYAFILRDKSTDQCLLIDPTIPDAVTQEWNKLKERHPLASIVGILCTHKHKDHTLGNAEMSRRLGGNIPVYGGKADNVRFLGEDKFTVEFDQEKSKIKPEILTLGLNTKVRVIHVPSHTRGSVLYVVSNNDNNREEGEEATKEQCQAVFTGDTLFTAGVGFFFEERENGAEMQRNFDEITQLNDDCLVYPAHEYAASNIRFGLMVEPDNMAMKELKQAADRTPDGICIPTTIAQERQHNVFMRTGLESVQKLVKELVDKWEDQGLADLSAYEFTYQRKSDFIMALRLLKSASSVWYNKQ